MTHSTKFCGEMTLKIHCTFKNITISKIMKTRQKPFVVVLLIAGLNSEFAMEIRLTLVSQRSACFRSPSVVIKGMFHQAQPENLPRAGRHGKCQMDWTWLPEVLLWNSLYPVVCSLT